MIKEYLRRKLKTRRLRKKRKSNPTT